MKGKEMRVLIKRPGEPTEERVICDELNEFYKIIGTDIIEIIRFPNMSDCVFILDEEGKLRDEIKPNVYLAEYEDALVGTVIVAGDDGEGELISLTDTQIEKAKLYMEQNYMSEYKGKIEPRSEVYFFDNDKDFWAALGIDVESDDEAEM